MLEVRLPHEDTACGGDDHFAPVHGNSRYRAVAHLKAPPVAGPVEVEDSKGDASQEPEKPPRHQLPRHVDIICFDDALAREEVVLEASAGLDTVELRLLRHSRWRLGFRTKNNTR